MAKNIKKHFYPRSPCGERPHPSLSWSKCRYFYPRSPCGERPKVTKLCIMDSIISIHALLAESDPLFCPTVPRPHNFYPRSPCGERRQSNEANGLPTRISIHALLAESDIRTLLPLGDSSDFYPRSPCGERRYKASLSRNLRYFYPRSPCGERPYHVLWQDTHEAISIHALLAESDLSSPEKVFPFSDFYPRSPCGERHP